MDLLKYYLWNHGINGVSIKEYQQLLTNSHPVLTMLQQRKGVLVIKTNRDIVLQEEDKYWKELNNHTIGCVCEYYKPVGINFKKPSSKNPYVDCEVVKSAFNLNTHTIQDCMRCHRICYEESCRKDGQLERVRRKR